MRTAKRKQGKYRVGDWVSLIYGPQMMLAQVTEDQGGLGESGSRRYAIRLDNKDAEPSILQRSEDELQATTEADQLEWQQTGKIGIQQILGYWHKDGDQLDHSKPLYHYLVVAKSRGQAGTGTATIFLLSGQRAVGVTEESLPTIRVPTGGPEAALAKAKEYLDTQHEGLKTWASKPVG